MTEKIKNKENPEALEVKETDADNGDVKGVQAKAKAAVLSLDKKKNTVEKAQNNLEAALKILQSNLPDFVEFNLGQLEFEKLEGIVVGRCTAEKIKIDPIMLLHTADRLAAVLMHEVLHQNNEITHDGLVEAMRQNLMGKFDDLPNSYTRLLEDIKEFARLYSKKGDEKSAIEEIYQLYAQEKYDIIYYRFYARVNGQHPFVNEAKIIEYFRGVFTELSFDENNSISNEFEENEYRIENSNGYKSAM